ncbi:polyprenyl synthetase family protein [bacterium]|nr:polyprenyl synthetase family protein [bacterium]
MWMTASDTTLFPPEIESFRHQIDSQLEVYSELDDDCPEHLREAIRYCLLAPGKRIRPLLVLTAAKICGGDLSNAMPAACAVEMIHNYSLIHDDLPAMDDDELRRGRPTCHVKFGEATAILAGDSLIPMAFGVLSRDIQPAEIAVQCIERLALASGPTRLVGGQADDLNLQFAASDVRSLEHIHRRKTGALLTVSLEMGALTASADAELRNSLVNYGKNLGLAFQIVDDLLDLRGSQAKMGKKIGKDAALGKQTYPAVLGEAASEARAHQMVEAAIEALKPFGEQAKALELLANFVVNRTQ